MLFTGFFRRLGTIASLALLATACGDDPLPPDDEPETASVVLTIAGTGVASQTVTWNTANNSVTPAQITVPSGATRTITAQFLRADASVDPAVIESDFRLDFNVTGTRATVAKTANLAASITAAATGTPSTFTLSLFHLGEGHVEYGPSNAIAVSVP